MNPTNNNTKNGCSVIKLFVISIFFIVLVKIVFIPDKIDVLVGILVTILVIDTAVEAKLLQKLLYAINNRFRELFWVTVLGAFFCYQPVIMKWLNDNVSNDYLTWVNPVLNVILVLFFAGITTYYIHHLEKKVLTAKTEETVDKCYCVPRQKHKKHKSKIKVMIVDDYEENIR